jgi:hypothetical protein
MRGNPYGSHSSTVRLAPQGLLSLRYIEEIVSEDSTGDDWAAGRNKVAAGMNPAAIAMSAIP